jgi:hypothetical protein
VPILETPLNNPLFGKRLMIFESLDIMNFLNDKLKLGLYPSCAFEKARVLHTMALLDKIPVLLLGITLSKGTHKKSIKNLVFLFDKLET